MTRLLILVLSSFVLFGPAYAQFQSVRIQVLDRGQADGIVIRTPNQEWIVIDSGTNAQQADYMASIGVDSVALAVVSHRHFDHLGGMDTILARFDVEQFLGITEDCVGNVSDDYVRDELGGVDIITLVDTPSTISIDGVDFTILPLETIHDCPDEENLNSMVVRMDYGDFSMLFTGDVEEEALDWLVANYADLLDVDKASHHGSNNGYTDEFLEAVSPDRVVISAGVNATYGHPMAQAVDDYEDATEGRVYCTNRHSSITVYGFEDGRIRTNTLRQADQSCEYDGTYY
jgi:competence protein ComEC